MLNIGFDGYRVNCIIGTEPHERQTPQDLLVDLKIRVDLASISDNLEDTVNYLSLVAICKDLAEKGRYHLIEKYAADVVEEIFNLFPITFILIRVKKPQAISEAEYAFVELVREKK